MPLEAAVTQQRSHNNKIPTFSQVRADHRDNNPLYCIDRRECEIQTYRIKPFRVYLFW
jgi:hypothetical protein